MTTAARVEILRNYASLVAELGGDAAALLRKAQIPAAALQRPDSYVSFRAVVQLLERSAEVLGCEDFGLRLAARQGLEIFGPVAVAAQNCSTLGEALDCFCRYFHTHNPGLQIVSRPQKGGKLVRVCLDLLLERPPQHRQFEERAMALMQRCLQLLSDGRCRPQQALLTHRRLSPPATYRASFGCAVHFEQPCAAIEIVAADLQLPVRDHNPQLRQLATAFLDSQGARSQATTGARVRSVVKSLLPGGNCSHDSVAAALLLHPRTLQRRLAAEGSSFEALRDAVRRDLAEHYLTASSLPLSQVTALLGYSEQSALTRSCRRWFRRAPLALRQKARGSAGG